MRNVARIKLGYYPLPSAEGSRLRRLLTFPSASALGPPSNNSPMVRTRSATQSSWMRNAPDRQRKQALKPSTRTSSTSTPRSRASPSCT